MLREILLSSKVHEIKLKCNKLNYQFDKFICLIFLEIFAKISLAIR